MNHLHCIPRFAMDPAELPPPTRTITNSSIEGALEIEAAFSDTHELASRLQDQPLAPLPRGHHGQWFGANRYCVPCDGFADGINHPSECPACNAGWEAKGDQP